jgi:hypothetical protein
MLLRVSSPTKGYEGRGRERMFVSLTRRRNNSRLTLRKGTERAVGLDRNSPEQHWAPLGAQANNDQVSSSINQKIKCLTP